jgi:hypothetical protein
MTHVVYKIVKHGEGWAYQVGQTFSETYLDHDGARSAARAAAKEHELAGNTVGITFEDKDGRWHEELSSGRDRPVTSVIE